MTGLLQLNHDEETEDETMKNLQQERIRHLRSSAEHCRVLAHGAVPFRIGKEIEAFADALDADAQKLEDGLMPVARHAKVRRKAVLGRV